MFVYIMDRVNHIIDTLYIGNHSEPEQNYQKYDLIVNCTKDLPFMRPRGYIRIPVNDEPGEQKNMYNWIMQTRVLDIIHQFLINRKNVLVHCYAGMQRSCAVVACYFVKYRNIDVDDAIRFIKKKRKIAFFGNVNFRKTIEMF